MATHVKLGARRRAKETWIGKPILALSDLDKAEKNAAAARRNTGRYSGAIDQQTQD